MTAIAGFACQDGVVIAAETEETYQDNKVYTHKLFPFARPNWKLGIAGAGIGYLIDYAKDKISEDLDTGNTKSAKEFRVRLQEILDRLYRKEFRVYPSKSRDIQLLVVAQFTNPLDSSKWMEPALFECQSNLVTIVKPHPQPSRVLGTGELVKELASKYADWSLPADLAEWACINVIYDAKRRYSGVGGKTHTFRLMQDGKHIDRPGADVPRKEDVLEYMDRVNLLLALSLSPSLTKNRSRDFVDAAKKWYYDAREAIQDIELSRGKTKYTKVGIPDRDVQKMVRDIRRLTAQKSKQEQ